MKTLLIINCIALAISIVFSTVCFIGLVNAEKKLAKLGESAFFKKEK